MGAAPKRKKCRLRIAAGVSENNDRTVLTHNASVRMASALARLEDAGVLRRLVESKRDGLWGASAILDEADRLLSRIASTR